ncbi:hypothetical protein BDF19DRAFT_422186 [Syncephalis fuscata]|nr:hypothetical protein BDF19DRAFT_422186 [Syncephalis fuscata]
MFSNLLHDNSTTTSKAISNTATINVEALNTLNSETTLKQKLTKKPKSTKNELINCTIDQENTTSVVRTISANSTTEQIDCQVDKEEESTTFNTEIDTNARPITTKKFNDRLYTIPHHYRWPKMKLKTFSVGKAIPKVAEYFHLLPWQIQYSHAIPRNLSFLMTPEAASEQQDRETTDQAQLSMEQLEPGVASLLQTAWHPQATTNQHVYNQLVVQLEDVVHSVWYQLINTYRINNPSLYSDVPNELPGPIADAAVVDMVEKLRKLLLCMIQLQAKVGSHKKPGHFDNWQSVCMAASFIDFPPEVINRVKEKMKLKTTTKTTNE